MPFGSTYSAIEIDSRHVNEVEVAPVTLSSEDVRGRTIRYVAWDGNDPMDSTGLTARFYVDQGTGLYCDMSTVSGAETATFEVAVPMGNIDAGYHRGCIVISDSGGRAISTRAFPVVVEKFMDSSGDAEMMEVLDDMHQIVQDAIASISAANQATSAANTATANANTATANAGAAATRADNAAAAIEQLFPADNSVTTAKIVDGAVTDAKLAQTGGMKSTVMLQEDTIQDTVQTIAFDGSGNVSSITHTSGNTAVRTDTFTFSDNEVVEVRTLYTGESLTITTNTDTLVTTTAYADVA